MTIKFIDLFAGIGGFRYGLEKSSQKYQCVWSNEWDKYAADIYDRRFNTTIDRRDITTVPSSNIPDHNLLVGGFPCQSFSIAGKRKGFNDTTRGTLFFEITRILRDKRPRYFILENVKGLLSHDSGKTFQTILRVLTDLGYEYQWQVLNSKNFGVPQNRERVFIVGHLRGTGRPKVFPITGQSEGHLEYLGGVISDRDLWLNDGKAKSRNFSQGQRVYKTSGISSTLAGNAGGLGGKTGLYGIDLSMKKSRLTEKARALQARYWKGYSNREAETTGIKDGMRIRRLTPLECERLQGFPDGWTEGVSDTQRYKCLGNAVTTNVITEIGKRLLASLP